MSVGDGDVIETGGDGEGDESIAAMEASGEGGLIESDAPCGVVAQVEDEGLRNRGVEGKARGSGAGSGTGGNIRVDVRVGWKEPVRWIGLVEGSIAGGDGSVFVVRLGASVGTEGVDAGGYGVLWVAVLVKEMECGEREGCGDSQGEGCGWKGFELQRRERKGQGEAHGCRQNCEESPGELQEK